MKATANQSPQIYINGQLIDITFEKEENLGDIYTEIENWISQGKSKFIYSVSINDSQKNLLREHEASLVTHWKKISRNTIERMDFFIGDQSELLLDAVHEWNEYIDRLGSALFLRYQTIMQLQKESSGIVKGKADSQVRIFESATIDFASQSQKGATMDSDIIEGLAWMKSLAESIATNLKLSKEDLQIYARVDQVEQMSVCDLLVRIQKKVTKNNLLQSPKQALVFLEELLEVFRSLKSFVQNLRLQLLARHASLDDIYNELALLFRKLQKVDQDWSEINLDLQVGKDEQGMQKLETQVQKLHGLVMTMQLLAIKVQKDYSVKLLDVMIDNNTFAKFLKNTFEKKLIELAKYLESGDLVSVGDLVEYEMSQHFQHLRQFLQVVLEQVKAIKATKQTSEK